MHRAARIHAALYQNAASNQAGPPQPTAAMDQDPITRIEQSVNIPPGALPGGFEPLIRNTDINDWQMNPIHSLGTNLQRHVLDVQ